jgi:hypothetical protein
MKISNFIYRKPSVITTVMLLKTQQMAKLWFKRPSHHEKLGEAM